MQLSEVCAEVAIVALADRLQGCTRNCRIQNALRLASDIKIVPRFDGLIATYLTPGIENLFQPLFDLVRRNIDRMGGFGDRRIVFDGGHRDQAPVRTCRLILSVDRLPERGKRQEEGLAFFQLLNLQEQVIEHRFPVDALAFELKIVANFSEARIERIVQRVVVEILALGIAAMAGRLEGA